MQQRPPSHGMFTGCHLHTKGSLTMAIVIAVVRQDTRQLNADSEMHMQVKSICRSVQNTLLKSKSAPRPVCVVKEEERVEYPLGLYHMAAATNPSPMTETLSVETFPVTMEINTEATLLLVSEASLPSNV